MRIGQLRQLVELHVRYNQFRFLPLSLAKLKLFTFTCECSALFFVWFFFLTIMFATCMFVTFL